MRQALDYYRTLIIGGTYVLDGSHEVVASKGLFIKALKHCIAIHPMLSAAISGEETESPTFVRPSPLDLTNHIDLPACHELPGDVENWFESDLVKHILKRTNDQTFTSRDKVPPWKIVVLPLHNTATAKCRFLILFAYCHSHGDGKSGLAFHKTFLSGLQLASSPNCPYSDFKECIPPTTPLVPTMEQAGKLSISWSYMLSPLLGAYLPKFVTGPLNLHASTTPHSDDQWIGRQTCYDSTNFSTGLELLSITNANVQSILTRCRAHGVKFTGLLHQIIVHALSQALPAGAAGSFLSQTAVDLRKHLTGITNNDMALCTTAYYELFARSDPAVWSGWLTGAADDTASIWDAARATTEGLVRCGGTLHDQPVGLLAYLFKFYPWTRGQIGKRRENSYELSNLLSFDPDDPGTADAENAEWGIESMVFSQPANAGGGCLSFNVVARKGGDFTLVLSWQVGVLDVDDEQVFASEVCASIRKSLLALAVA